MAAVEDAVSFKEKGNKAFKEHDWPTAISFYTQAIELNDKDPAFYTNRAQVRQCGKARDTLLYDQETNKILGH